MTNTRTRASKLSASPDLTQMVRTNPTSIDSGAPPTVAGDLELVCIIADTDTMMVSLRFDAGSTAGGSNLCNSWIPVSSPTESIRRFSVPEGTVLVGAESGLCRTLLDVDKSSLLSRLPRGWWRGQRDLERAFGDFLQGLAQRQQRQSGGGQQRQSQEEEQRARQEQERQQRLQQELQAQQQQQQQQWILQQQQQQQQQLLLQQQQLQHQ